MELQSPPTCWNFKRTMQRLVERRNGVEDSSALHSSSTFQKLMQRKYLKPSLFLCENRFSPWELIHAFFVWLNQVPIELMKKKSFVSTPKWRQEARRKGETSSGHKKKLKGDLTVKQLAPIQVVHCLTSDQKWSLQVVDSLVHYSVPTGSKKLSSKCVIELP